MKELWDLKDWTIPEYRMNARLNTLEYRGTSLIRKRPPPQDHRRALGVVLL